MPSIYKAKSAIMKYDPVWLKSAEIKTPENDHGDHVIRKPEPESLLRLNKIAKGYPFCIMYHTKEHDPL